MTARMDPATGLLPGPRFVVMFSGGIGSWMAARRTVADHGADRVVLLFADTLVEDPDLYRFIEEAAEDVGAPLIRIADGRDIWQVFKDRRMLGNSRIANCSTELKQRPARRWMEENAPDATVVLGLDWTEVHRLPGAVAGWAPFSVVAPLCAAPYLTKRQMMEALEDCGIQRPELYRLGFAHNNCGGGCVRAGQGQFIHLYRTKPDVYARWEAGEAELREYLGADVSILRDRTGGDTSTMTLAKLREGLERQPALFGSDEWGGCGCFVSEGVEA